VQGLLIHQHIAPAYGVTLSRNQRTQSQVRAVEKILDDIVARDSRPLSILREANARQVGVCRHFTLLHVAMLRTQGIPARARCGFGAYFEKAKYLDHWVLPWDIWGAMRRHDNELDLGFFDQLAIVSSDPDADELNALYCDERVNVPRTVFNAELKCLQEL
jgi:hypothetical protein